MTVLLLFLIPLIGGLVTFFLKEDKAARGWSLLVAFAAMAVSIKGFADMKSGLTPEFSAPWMGSLGASFSLSLDGLSGILTLLTGIAYPIILLATWKTPYRKPGNFFGLMLLTQAGLMGVFTATDALLFYFFWELALIPVYFLCSGWGGERRIQVTFKFFIYTFTGSVIMLIALLYLYSLTPDQSFSLESFYALNLSHSTQGWIFWMLFIAFAIKMPVFPFHTWQPDTYEQSPTAVTMVLSGLMVKMGVFGVLRWVLPVVPDASYIWGDVVMSLSVIGILYASIIALQQDDLKRLVAYSSIAHIGLMSAAIFALSRSGMQGVMIQLFHHGVNIIGLWIVVELVERQFGTRKLSQLGGIAAEAPALTILLVVVAFANVALPLTNSFPGEFLMFNGIWNSGGTKYNIVFTVLAILSIILGAAYTLRMVQAVFFGAANERTATGYRLKANETVALCIVVALILWFGVYPQPLIDATKASAQAILKAANYTNIAIK
ncbi:NADH-quinone oxidoreductase subunit M [Flaviaesturariibacter flavus]|uniref:NADH-quinone oxidoreductase subunit M n=1 Tax=Flaviaesturariibacter flavus TaxID=2502780 RepID=A0A4R1BBN2_9BACT|nr:NADH-quinone oxidoreductase subunit M [Flaviaesturariibacter flavus]TCJ14416.1 NADH-quinone oxidoreductase subunit M [Flaviaesturariibacter flavus]